MIEYFKTTDGYVALEEKVIKGKHGPFRMGHGPHWDARNQVWKSVQRFNYGLEQISGWEMVDVGSVPKKWLEAFRRIQPELEFEYYLLVRDGYCAIDPKQSQESGGPLRKGRGQELGTGLGDRLVGEIVERFYGHRVLRNGRRIDRKDVPEEWLDALDAPIGSTTKVTKKLRQVWAILWGAVITGAILYICWFLS